MNPKEIRAVSVAVTDAGRFLLVLRGRAPAKGIYAFPGGRIEKGETAETAARRELFEETGLFLREMQFIKEIVLAGADAGPTFRLSVFRARYEGGVVEAGDDAASAGWFTLESMRHLPVTQSTLELAEEIAAAHQG